MATMITATSGTANPFNDLLWHTNQKTTSLPNAIDYGVTCTNHKITRAFHNLASAFHNFFGSLADLHNNTTAIEKNEATITPLYGDCAKVRIFMDDVKFPIIISFPTKHHAATRQHNNRNQQIP
jgi:hypothetical protein